MRKRLLILVVTALVVAVTNVPSAADWNPEDGHKMHFPQLPDLNGIDVAFAPPLLLADDWQCSQSGPVEDIHFWFSARGDWLDPAIPLEQQISNIHLSIHSNIPDPDGQGPLYSMPGDLLWQRDFSAADVQIIRFVAGLQAWWNPATGAYIPDDHQFIWLCNVTNIDIPFYQKEGEIYWLDVQMEAAGELGWKSADLFSYPEPYTGVHFEDDAVWQIDPPAWGELRYPVGPLEGQSMDLAFVITGGGPPFDHKMHFPQGPDPEGLDVHFQPPKVLADDWLCTETGGVWDIHFWFSARMDWLDPAVPWGQQIFTIHVSIHDNIPDPDGDGPLYSMPGELLWQRDYTARDVEITPYVTAGQDWFDPNTGEYAVDDHVLMYRCDIRYIEDPFVQREGEIYWLDVWVESEGPLGWKVADVDRYPDPYTGRHFEDDAVWGDLPDPTWQELIWVWGPKEGQSIDLAFVVTNDWPVGFGDSDVPREYRLMQNTPNPFNPVTTIRYVLPKPSDVKLAIFDVNGRLIRTLVDGPMPMGMREATWDALDHNGNPVASGVYFYRLETGSFVEARKMVLLK
jgi:hypothetical protein